MRRIFLLSALLLALAALAAPGTASAQFVDRPEFEPNNSIAMPDFVPVAVDTAIHGSIAPATDIDFFEVIVGSQTVVSFETWVPDRPTCTPPVGGGGSADTVIRLWNSAGVQIGEDDDGGVGLCSLLVRNLNAGTYFISVERFGFPHGQTPIVAYTLEIDFQDPQSASVTLEPEFDENPVGTPHTVTATVRDHFGTPVPGQPVEFVVTGSGTPVPATGANVTDTNGQATFTFTNTARGSNGIQAFVPGCCSSNLVIKDWLAVPPRTLTLFPPAGVNPVGTQHCVTATVRDDFGNPVPNVIVRFSVTGSVNTGGSDTTDASGMATFCYNGPPLPGADVIHAYADTNNNNVQDDPNEPFGDATKAWVLPPSTPGCEVKITNGGWIIANNDDRASFGGNAKVDVDGNVTGNEEYQDHGPADPMKLHGNVLVVICTSTTEATVYGEATIDGAGSFIYRIKVRDLAEPGKDMDTYELLVDNGYYSGDKTLQGGNVQVNEG
jgi:hypothetical protein